MAIKIGFDVTGNPEEPTLVLARRNGDKLGKINAKSIEVSGNMVNACEITFNVHKYIDNEKDCLWDLITNFKLVHCVEWDKWFEISVEVDESNETVKTVFCTLLGHAELSQIMLYNVEINTEIDIERDAYVLPTVLYREDNPEASLMHRILEKAPHYSVLHVDDTIKNMQRTFSFSDTSIYDACQEIAEELNCLFVFNSNSKDRKIQRTISIYDLESNCTCGYRGEFFDVCPECGSKVYNDGYGEDTTIFVRADEIANDIQFTTDVDAIKNCFKLEAGDDLMTATVKNCNPNGTDYIWYIPDSMKEDMSDELVSKLNEYDKLYEDYQVGVVDLNTSLLDEYNKLVDKYDNYNEDLEKIDDKIVGFPSLIDAYYNTFDLALYLQSGLMPSIDTAKPSMQDEANKLSDANNISPVAVNVSSSSSNPLKAASISTVDNIVLSMAKTIVDSRYRVKVADNSILSDYEESATERIWAGHFIVSAYSDSEDEEPIHSENINVVVNADYETFVRRKIDKVLSDTDEEDVSISGLFKLDESKFKEAIKEYSLNRLTSFYDACQSCIDIMIEQGVADGETWGNTENVNLYEELYVPYYNKLGALEDEIAVRDSEIALIVGVKNEDDELITPGLQNIIEEKIKEIQDALDFEKFVGEELWLEFCSFRREDKYSNENYTSEGLNNAEMIDKAKEFIEVAQKEIYKSSERQCSITANLKNLLVIDKFKPLVDKFETGNWLRVMVDDKVYKLRLIGYSINYDDLANISVEFSDTVRINSSIKSVQGVLSQASSMATSYPAVKRQAKQGEESNGVINGWFSSGLDATNVNIIGGADGQTQSWDNHGMLFREYDPASNEYSPEQMKIVNSTLAITDDNWQTIKTAVGKFHYVDPATGEMKMAYGVNGEVLIGKLMLGENLMFTNNTGTLTFNESGLSVKDDKNSVNIMPGGDESIFNIKKGDSNIFYISEETGDIYITGNIIATSINAEQAVEGKNVSGFADIAVTGKASDLINDNNYFKQVALTGNYSDLSGAPTLAKVATTGNYNDLSDTPTLATVATSGKYDDLTDKPELKDIATSGKYSDLVVEETDEEKLFYVKEGKVTSISIDELKQLLGI